MQRHTREKETRAAKRRARGGGGSRGGIMLPRRRRWLCPARLLLLGLLWPLVKTLMSPKIFAKMQVQ